MISTAPYPLAYCLNVHRADTLSDVLRAIETGVIPVRDLVAPGRLFPVGLYLSDTAARELDAVPRRLESFRRRLAANGLYVRMVNAFPFGGFHAVRVKTAAYHPDWRSPLRLDYTRRCARILASLMPEGDSGSVTTVPGGWAPDWTDPPADTRAAFFNLRAAAETCREIFEDTGRTVRIALEPEPGCVWDLDDPAVEDALPPEIGWCLDTCHVAVDGVPLPEPGDSVWRRIYRVQLSAALEAPNTPEARAALLPFAEPAYLHQTRLFLDGHRIASWDDLPEALADLPHYPADATIRSHFHVPLDWPGTVPLRTTRGALTPVFLRAASRIPCEVETYTHSVLPPVARPIPDSLPAAIAAELSWVLPRMTEMEQPLSAGRLPDSASREVATCPVENNHRKDPGMKDLIACCGLDCEACDARIATLHDDRALREKTARRWSELNGVEITPEMINCEGCRTGGAKTPYCESLCPIRRCVLEKGIGTCGGCAELETCAKVGMVIGNNPGALRNLKGGS